MADLMYKSARVVGYPFRYRVIGLENIIPDRPSIFISNHAGSLGPLSIFISLPVRLHPWVIAEMTDIPRTADYLYKDFILPAWHLRGKFGRQVSKLIAPIAVGVIKSTDPISVDRNQGWVRDAFFQSLELLKSGGKLLIFPENPERDKDDSHEIRPFLGGFCWLSQMYQKSTGEPLVIQPMAVYPKGHRMILGSPITLDISGDIRTTIQSATKRLQDIVLSLYYSIKEMK